MVAVGMLVAGCGAKQGDTAAAGQGAAGYRVLMSGVTLPLAGEVQPAAAQSTAAQPVAAPWVEVPSQAGRWWGMPSSSALSVRGSKVELMATGGDGPRFHLYWQETCGGTKVGKRGVLGGSGGEGSLTLRAPALVLVKLPASQGNVDTCYLATTVALHMKTWRDAKAAAPRVRIVHY